jgi:hypothetical protein
VTTVTPKTLRYTWKHAKAGSTYRVRVVADSSAGSAASAAKRFHT